MLHRPLEKVLVDAGREAVTVGERTVPVAYDLMPRRLTVEDGVAVDLDGIAHLVRLFHRAEAERRDLILFAHLEYAEDEAVRNLAGDRDLGACRRGTALGCRLLSLECCFAHATTLLPSRRLRRADG